MRTLNQVDVVQDSNAKYPFGSTIKNETETQEGTAIVAEYMADIIQNIYKVVELAGITPTGTEDSDDTQYQIVEAFKKLPNSLNDIEQVLTLTGTVWSVNLDLTKLPNKYVLFAKSSEDYNEETTYTFKGTTSLQYGFTSNGFRSGDTLIVIVNTGGVRAIPVSSNNVNNDINITLGLPLSFIQGNKMWYESQGKLMSDTPSVANIQSILRTELDDATLILNDMFIIKGVVLCFCLIPGSNQYFFRAFTLPNLTASSAVDYEDTDFDASGDFVPYVYADKNFVYVTNAMNYSPNAYQFTKLFFNADELKLYFNSTLSIDNSFEKTTNAVIKSGFLYTMLLGELVRFNLTSGVKTSLGIYPEAAGQLFGFNDSVYFNVGQVAKKWF